MLLGRRFSSVGKYLFYSSSIALSATAINTHQRSARAESARDDALVTDSNDMEQQLAQITGTFRADIVSYILRESANKSFSEIVSDLYKRNPAAVTEFVFICGGAAFSTLAYIKGRQRRYVSIYDTEFTGRF